MASTVPRRVLSPALPPLPPPDLGTRNLPLKEFSSTTVWQRLHPKSRKPIYFGRSSSNRFDAPSGEFGVLYLGEDVYAAFAETFLREPGRTLIAERDIQTRSLAEVTPSRALKLVQVTGPGLAKIGATAAVSSGPYSISQAWSLALWSHREKPDGLLYRARHDDQRLCAAIYDRVGNIFATNNLGPLTANPRLLGNLLDTYGVALA